MMAATEDGCRGWLLLGMAAIEDGCNRYVCYRGCLLKRKPALEDIFNRGCLR